MVPHRCVDRHGHSPRRLVCRQPQRCLVCVSVSVSTISPFLLLLMLMKLSLRAERRWWHGESFFFFPIYLTLSSTPPLSQFGKRAGVGASKDFCHVVGMQSPSRPPAPPPPPPQRKGMIVIETIYSVHCASQGGMRPARQARARACCVCLCVSYSCMQCMHYCILFLIVFKKK